MRPIRKLPASYAGIVLPFLLSLMMSAIVSGISTLRAVGWTPDVLTQWLQGWGISWLVAFPTLLVVMPAVRRMTSWFVEMPGR